MPCEDRERTVREIAGWFEFPDNASTIVTAENILDGLLKDEETLMYLLAVEYVKTGRTRSSLAQLAESAFDNACDE